MAPPHARAHPNERRRRRAGREATAPCAATAVLSAGPPQPLPTRRRRAGGLLLHRGGSRLRSHPAGSAAADAAQRVSLRRDTQALLRRLVLQGVHPRMQAELLLHVLRREPVVP